MNKTINGFTWLIITDKAEAVFRSGLFEVYKLYDDGSEALCESIEDVNDSMDRGFDFGISVGVVTNNDSSQ